MAELLSIKNLSVSTSKVQIKNIWLDIFKAETVGLFELYQGEASLLLDTLCGLFPNYTGEISMLGHSVNLRNEYVAQEVGLYRIQSKSNLVNQISVAENIFVIRSSNRRYFRIDSKAIEKQTEDLLKSIETNVSFNDKVSQLSTAQKHQIELAKAVALGCKIIIYDRAFSNYTQDDLLKQRTIMDHLKKNGISFIINCNYVEELRLLADKVIFFRDSRISKKSESPVITDYEIIKYLINEEQSKSMVDVPIKENVKIDAIGDVRKFIYQRQKLIFNEAEILSIVCPNQYDRELIFNFLSREQKHSVEFFVKKLKDNQEEIEEVKCDKEDIACIHNLWGEDELFTNLSITENILLPSFKKINQVFGYLSHNYFSLIEKETKTLFNHQDLNSLSTIEKATLLLERWSVYKPKLLIIYEPFLYSDVITEKIIVQKILDLASRGTSFVLISAKKQKMLSLSDRVIVVEDKIL